MNLNWKYSGEIFGSCLSVFNLSVFISMPLFTYLLLKKNKQELSKEAFQKKFGDLYIEFNIHDWNAVMFNVYFLIRRLLFAITIIFADFFPTA